MKKILDRGDSNSEIFRRLETDVADFNNIELKVDYILNNDGYIEECFLELEFILDGLGFSFELRKL